MKKTSPKKLGAYILTGTIMVMSVLLAQSAYAGNLSCTITTQIICNNTASTTILRMTGSTNAHAELPGNTTLQYDGNVVCCTGVTGLSNSCAAAATTTVLRLSGSSGTNAHVEQKNLTNANYNTNLACIGVGTGGTVSTGYGTDCTVAGYDTTLASMSSTTYAHVGNASAYSTKICASATSSPTGVAAYGTLTSSLFDSTATTTGGGSYNSIMWDGNQNGSLGSVYFQFAASDCTNGKTNAPACNDAGVWNFIGGSTCASGDWFNVPTLLTPVELVGSGAPAVNCSNAWNNKRYYRYKVKICSAANCDAGGGTASPIVQKIVVNWAP